MITQQKWQDNMSYPVGASSGMTYSTSATSQASSSDLPERALKRIKKTSTYSKILANSSTTLVPASISPIRILDRDVSVYSSLIGYLLLKNIQSPFPHDCSLPYHLKIIEYYEKYLSHKGMHFNPSLRTSGYSLYYYDQPIAELQGLNRGVMNKKLLNEALSWIEFALDEAINSFEIKKKAKSILLEGLRRDIEELLINKLYLLGNRKRKDEISEEELLLDDQTKQMHLCEKILLDYRRANNPPPDVTKDYPFVNLHNYSLGELPLEKIASHSTDSDYTLKALNTIHWTRIAENAVSLREKTPTHTSQDFALRIFILKSDPSKKTFEVMLTTNNPSKRKNGIAWMDSRIWASSQFARRAKVLVNLEFLARTLGKKGRMPSLPACILFRGNSCAGKTTVKNALMRPIRKDSKDLANAVLTNDYLSERLKQLPGYIALNSQQYLESASFFLSVRDPIVKDPAVDYVLDSRLLTPEDVKKHLHREKLHIYDLENSSLRRYLLRMLTRPPFGKEPSQDTAIILDGYIKAIQHRQEILSLALEHTCVEKYELYFDSRLIAEKKIDEAGQPYLTIKEGCLEDFNKCVRLPEDYQQLFLNECELILTQQLIDEAILNGTIHPHQGPLLTQWIGYPLGKAVDMNANGVEPLPATQETF